jgi:hypothetical protein
MTQSDEVAGLKARIAKLEARLEIDHAFRVNEDGTHERFEIPAEQRDNMPDRILANEIEIIHLSEWIIDAYDYALSIKDELTPEKFEILLRLLECDYLKFKQRRRLENVNEALD